VKVGEEAVPSGNNRADHELGMVSTFQSRPARRTRQETRCVDELAGSGGTAVIGTSNEKETHEEESGEKA
jgi:hypothetical protein